MQNIEVKILEHNCDGMPIFLAKLTQRGHEISKMSDLLSLYEDNIHKSPSETLLNLPHTTIKRMNYITVAVTGLSTKAVSQLRTHATRMTFISTSTQYSAFHERDDNFVLPFDCKIDVEKHNTIEKALNTINDAYKKMIEAGVDKDKASYLLPQALRKVFIMHGNLDVWQYVMSTRLCRRNTEEVQHIMRLIYDEIKRVCGDVYVSGMLPNCAYGECREGKFSCTKPKEVKDDYKL